MGALNKKVSAILILGCFVVSSSLLAFSGTASGKTWRWEFADADGDGVDENITYRVDEIDGLHEFIGAYHMQRRWHIGIENIHEIIYMDEERVLDSGYWSSRSGGTLVDKLYDTNGTIMDTDKNVITTWESNEARLKRIGNMTDERCNVTYQISVKYGDQFVTVAEVVMTVVWNDGMNTTSGALDYVIDKIEYFKDPEIGYLGPSPYDLTFTVNYTFDDYVKKIDNFSVIGWDGFSATDPDSPGIFGMLYQPEPTELTTEFSTDPCVEHTLAVWEIPGNEPPIANFTWDPPAPYEGDAIQFIDTSTDPDGQIVSWEWTFEYLAPSTEQNPIRTYGDNGVYNVTLEVADFWNATDNITKQVPVENKAPVVNYINVTLHRNAPRTHGYWKHQCTIFMPKKDHPGIRQEWINAIANQSQVFAGIQTKEEVCAYLDPPNPQTPMKKAKKQLMALWLNVVSGLLFMDSPLDHTEAPFNHTVREFIEHAERLILFEPTQQNLLWVNDVATDINEDATGYSHIDPVVGQFKANVTDPGSDDLTFAWDNGKGDPIIYHVHLNDPPNTEPPYPPYPSPWGIYPFNVVDELIVGYPKQHHRYYVCLISVSDDDGGQASGHSNCVGGPLGGTKSGSEDFGILEGGGGTSFQLYFEFNVTYRQIEGGFTIAEVWIYEFEGDLGIDWNLEGGFID